MQPLGLSGSMLTVLSLAVELTVSRPCGRRASGQTATILSFSCGLLFFFCQPNYMICPSHLIATLCQAVFLKIWKSNHPFCTHTSVLPQIPPESKCCGSHYKQPFCLTGSNSTHTKRHFSLAFSPLYIKTINDQLSLSSVTCPAENIKRPRATSSFDTPVSRDTSSYIYFFLFKLRIV